MECLIFHCTYSKWQPVEGESTRNRKGPSFVIVIVVVIVIPIQIVVLVPGETRAGVPALALHEQPAPHNMHSVLASLAYLPASQAVQLSPAVVLT